MGEDTGLTSAVADRRGRATVEGGERFAAFVAHELRTPLATQRALLELALGDPDADAATWREIGEDVLRACTHQERMLESCLAFARSDGGLRWCEAVDLGAIAADALHANDLGELESAAALQPAWTAADPVLIERLVTNLVTNAIRHNVPGGRIDVLTRTAAGRAVLTIANTGTPIPDAELQRLFQPFNQLGSRGGAPANGVGLGLAIVQTIADAHDATVTALAQTGGGIRIDVAFHGLD